MAVARLEGQVNAFSVQLQANDAGLRQLIQFHGERLMMAQAQLASMDARITQSDDALDVRVAALESWRTEFIAELRGMARGWKAYAAIGSTLGAAGLANLVRELVVR